jgi:hypothetical protein
VKAVPRIWASGSGEVEGAGGILLSGEGPAGLSSREAATGFCAAAWAPFESASNFAGRAVGGDAIAEARATTSAPDVWTNASVELVPCDETGSRTCAELVEESLELKRASEGRDASARCELTVRSVLLVADVWLLERLSAPDETDTSDCLDEEVYSPPLDAPWDCAGVTTRATEP